VPATPAPCRVWVVSGVVLVGTAIPTAPRTWRSVDEPSHRRVAGGHCFLEGVWDGSLPEHSFDRWLAQDYLFAQALVRAQSRIAATAPSPTSASSRAAWSRRPR
jgi:TENA/THI-4/PQQC family